MARLYDAVLLQLQWDPRVDSRNVGVAMVNGTLCIKATVALSFQKLAAEQAVRSVAGGHDIQNELTVRSSFCMGDRIDGPAARG